MSLKLKIRVALPNRARSVWAFSGYIFTTCESVEATKLPITVILPRNVRYRGSHFFNIPLNLAVTSSHDWIFAFSEPK
jgi:hypothetical protein